MNRSMDTSTRNLDVVVSHLRSQITTLHNTLETIEWTSLYQDEFVIFSLRNVEGELRSLRKFIDVD